MAGLGKSSALTFRYKRFEVNELQHGKPPNWSLKGLLMKLFVTVEDFEEKSSKLVISVHLICVLIVLFVSPLCLLSFYIFIYKLYITIIIWELVYN